MKSRMDKPDPADEEHPELREIHSRCHVLILTGERGQAAAGHASVAVVSRRGAPERTTRKRAPTKITSRIVEPACWRRPRMTGPFPGILKYRPAASST